jgi:hypothetical protein
MTVIFNGVTLSTSAAASAAWAGLASGVTQACIEFCSGGSDMDKMQQGNDIAGGAQKGYNYLNDNGYKVNFSDNSGAPQGRSLTPNEIRESLRAGYMHSYYDLVKIYDDKYVFFQGEDYAMAPNGNIYWPGASHCSDLTNCTVTVKGKVYDTLPTFIHEMAHVYQHYKGVNVALSALPHQILHHASFRTYNPYMSRREYRNTPSPEGLNVEAQADWYMHNYCVNTGYC